MGFSCSLDHRSVPYDHWPKYHLMVKTAFDRQRREGTDNPDMHQVDDHHQWDHPAYPNYRRGIWIQW
jgi:hypothetical protein